MWGLGGWGFRNGMLQGSEFRVKRFGTLGIGAVWGSRSLGFGAV